MERDASGGATGASDLDGRGVRRCGRDRSAGAPCRGRFGWKDRHLPAILEPCRHGCC